VYNIILQGSGKVDEQQFLEGKKWGQSWILGRGDHSSLVSIVLYLLFAVENVDTGSMGETIQNIFLVLLGYFL
jgi:hypothetical protein